MKKSTIFASIGIVVFVGVIAVSIAKIAGNPGQTGSVGTATRGGLTAYYVVCEEADIYGAPDPANAAGTVAMAINGDPAIIPSLVFSGTSASGLGSVTDGDGVRRGNFLVLNDQVSVGREVIGIEPGQDKVAVAGGKLKSYYCNSKTSGRAGSPLVVFAPDAETAISKAYKKDYSGITTYTSRTWGLTMFGHTFTGTAHQTP